MSLRSPVPPLPLPRTPAYYPAVIGDVVTIDGRARYVAAHCDERTLALYCVPCHQRLANGFQLAAHLETPGYHTIARDCALHGLEVL